MLPDDPRRLVCLPSWDDRFVDGGAAVLAAHRGLRDPSEFQAALRPDFPPVIVRASVLEGLRTPTWYVYRDGHFPWPQGRPSASLSQPRLRSADSRSSCPL